MMTMCCLQVQLQYGSEYQLWKNNGRREEFLSCLLMEFPKAATMEKKLDLIRPSRIFLILKCRKKQKLSTFLTIFKSQDNFQIQSEVG